MHGTCIPIFYRGTMNDYYNILKALCAVQDDPVHLTYGLHGFSKKFKYIAKTLLEYEVSFEIDTFTNDQDETFNNLYAYLGEYRFHEDRPTLVLMAHHDEYDSSFENCNDNNASVALLISLSKELNYLRSTHNIVVAFTDSEERGFKGAERLDHQLYCGRLRSEKLVHIINLELCAFGDHVWVEKHENNHFVKRELEHQGVQYRTTNCPATDAHYLRFISNQPSTTIGLLPVDEDGNLDREIWNKIHSEDDTLDTASEEHMYIMFSFLKKMIINATKKHYVDYV